jgi:hypothetical protein
MNPIFFGITFGIAFGLTWALVRQRKERRE